MITDILLYAGMGAMGLIVLYIVIRLCSSAVFRSYFEQKYEALSKRRNKHERP